MENVVGIDKYICFCGIFYYHAFTKVPSGGLWVDEAIENRFLRLKNRFFHQ